MPFVSVTRLRVRSIRFLPSFAMDAYRSRRQASSAKGFQDGAVLADRRWTFWTMTVWDTQESMRQYILSGAHGAAMRKLMDWCDEASLVHWDQTDSTLPTWPEAERRMRASGRVSKVRHPSPDHAEMRFLPPRLTGSARMRRASS